MIEIKEYLKSPDVIGETTPAAATFTSAKRTLAVDTGDTTELVNLGLADTRYQPLDSDLSAISGLTSAANKAIYFTGAGQAALFDITSAARSLLDDTDTATQRTTLGAVGRPASSTDDAIPRYDGADGSAIQNSLVTISDVGTVNIPTGQTYNINGVAHTHDYVAGPASATDNAITRFDSTTGKLVQDSLVSISDAGTVNIPTGQTYNINGVAHTHDYAASSHTHSEYASTAEIIALAIALGG